VGGGGGIVGGIADAAAVRAEAETAAFSSRFSEPAPLYDAAHPAARRRAARLRKRSRARAMARARALLRTANNEAAARLTYSADDLEYDTGSGSVAAAAALRSLPHSDAVGGEATDGALAAARQEDEGGDDDGGDDDEFDDDDAAWLTTPRGSPGVPSVTARPSVGDGFMSVAFAPPPNDGGAPILEVGPLQMMCQSHHGLVSSQLRESRS